MNIHILGVGSVGSLFAFHLKRALNSSPSLPAAAPAHICLHLSEKQRKARCDRSEPLSIKVERDGAVDHQDGFEIARSDSPIDILVIALKADITLSAMEPLVPRLCARPTPGTLVLLQNGVGQDEAIVKRFFASDPAAKPYIILGSNTHGTWRKEHLKVVHAAKGTMHFGLSRVQDDRISSQVEQHLLTTMEYPPCLHSAASTTSADDPYKTVQSAICMLSLPYMCSSLAIYLEGSRDFAMRSLRKLVANCVLNPLTALEECKNGELLERGHIRDKVPVIVRECANVLQARMQQQGQQGQEPLQQLSYSALLQHVRDVIELTALNWSSMVQDIHSARGSTEIDFLNGTIARWGEQMGIATPCNRDLVQSIKAKADRLANRSS
ncbi:hypothetical protein K437DRAFT_257694 [Tilletiaria anomala UBC 951]|uniref:2-dehydropantoate 2-reductase n=1 Tax=Tilletiaria anomala (strain ATCC 24038 / CBS 436.72 / UBC 951) TaxID=1037660 RepID=A0A066VMA6_TILAU|nr:uncharacterized protein K437DRAFT_257694 [Tilletiaria anomala UBC 951]KDN42847.1 hypothetical protein K437DRAFT_257694 [Tilletiaria anomala UBC 951]